MVRHILRGARRGGVFVLGVGLVALGLALLVLPGPGLLVTAVGLAVLSTEFLWARRAQMAVRRRVRAAAHDRWLRRRERA